MLNTFFYNLIFPYIKYTLKCSEYFLRVQFDLLDSRWMFDNVILRQQNNTKGY